MNFKKFEGGTSKTGGSYLIHKIVSTYDKLEETFGEPRHFAGAYGHKVDVQWTLQFEDGTLATIYNYKDGTNYLGANGLHHKHITNWSVGGHNYTAYTRVRECLIEEDSDETQSETED